MGIKTVMSQTPVCAVCVSEKPPHHMGIKTSGREQVKAIVTSEKPPHHMGIKTSRA